MKRVDCKYIQTYCCILYTLYIVRVHTFEAVLAIGYWLLVGVQPSRMILIYSAIHDAHP